MESITTTGVEGERAVTEKAEDAAVNEMFDTLVLEMNANGRSIKHLLLSMQCHDTRHHLVNLKAAKQINPSAVLSLLLNDDKFATVSAGGHMQKIPCVRVNATMKPTLKIGDRFASKPIFEVMIDGQKHDAQWTHESYLRIGVKDFQPPGVNTSYVFKIRERTYVFRNGELYKKKPTIKTLSIASPKLNLYNQVIV